VSVGNGHFEHRKAKGLIAGEARKPTISNFQCYQICIHLCTSGSDRAARLARTPAAASSPNLKKAWVAT
jgi:hypothetical protein